MPQQYLMVDVVINHVGYAGAPDTIDYSGFAKPFDAARWFHPYCPIRNYDNQTEVEQVR
jgi:alpha-amylase